MSTRKRHLITFLLGVGITLILAGLTPLLVVTQAQEATPDPEPAVTEGTAEPTGAAITPTGDNGYCLLCHNQPGSFITLEDGTQMNLYVPAESVAGSVHGNSNEVGALGCLDCHQDAFPHSGPSPIDGRAYTLDMVGLCTDCHQDQAEDLQNGLHQQAIMAGDTGAAVCTDCHGVHNVQPVSVHPELVAGVCGDCHTETMEQWQVSAHVDIGPLGCGSCHSPHSQQLRVGDTPDQLCVNCHSEENMPEVFVHSQHSSEDYTVGCTDCHMFLPEGAEGTTVAVADEAHMPIDHSMMVETVACNTCHEQLVVSGEWEEISGDDSETVRAAAIPDSGSAEEGAAAQETSYVQLLQGLILGIGFGITGAAIFVSRGNRRETVSNSKNEGQNEG